MDNEKIQIDIIYALPEQQYVYTVVLSKIITIEEAIHISGILISHPDINLQNNKIGVFGQITSLQNKISNNDQIEIYRPLYIDPKELRRKRIACTKK